MKKKTPTPTKTSPLADSGKWPCLKLAGKGAHQSLVLDVSVSPNAKRTEAVGWHDGALRVRLAAAPIEGAANEALRRWLSDELGLPQARITLLRGASGRRKQFAIEADWGLLADWLMNQVETRRIPPVTL